MALKTSSELEGRTLLRWGRGLRPRWRPRPENAAPGQPDEVEPPTPDSARSFTAFSKWAAVASLLFGYHIILGWVFGIGILKSPRPDFRTTCASAALCAFFSGFSLLFLQRRRDAAGRPPWRPAVPILAGVAGAIALACLVADARGLGERLQLLLPHAGVPAPPKMSVSSETAYLALSAAMLLLGWARAYRLAGLLCLATTAMSLLALAGYIYGAHAFTGQMSFYTSVIVLLLSLGALCARPDRGFMAKVASNSFGGVMARRLLPATLVIPIVLGWLQSRGALAGFFKPEPALALFALANVVIFVGLVWWSINSLYRMDTQRRQAERDLKQTAAKLQRSNADLEQFAYVASHDLKEPLRAISGSVQVLQHRFGERLGTDADEVIRHTVEGANRMQTLIDDLLTYSRLTMREAPVEPTECEGVLQEALSNLGAALSESHAVVTHDPMPTVRADRTQLLQVFQNLIGNAVKYHSARTPKIHVGAEDKGAEWLFSVRDNGIGIAPQYADRVFRIFQRLHTRQDYSGTGIGLAVCKKIVERHGGRIWFESEPEEGSTFYFTLPKGGV